MAAGISVELDAEPDADCVGGTPADAAIVRSLSADVPVSSRVLAQHAKASVHSKLGHRAILITCTLAQWTMRPPFSTLAPIRRSLSAQRQPRSQRADVYSVLSIWSWQVPIKERISAQELKSRRVCSLRNRSRKGPSHFAGDDIAMMLCPEVSVGITASTKPHLSSPLQ